MAGSPFTRPEVVLCAYAARYNAEEIGGIEAIHSLTHRSHVSIGLKIRNIAGMLDEENIERESDIKPLSGKPPGQDGHRTNWDIVAQLVALRQEDHLAECLRILEPAEDA